jgi:hypothetical protein
MDVDPIPGVGDVADAEFEQFFAGRDGLPGAVVKERRGVSRVVAGGKEPIGTEGDALAELCRVYIAGIGRDLLSLCATGTNGRDEQRKQE